MVRTSRKDRQLKDAAIAAGARACPRCAAIAPPTEQQRCLLEDCPRTLVAMPTTESAWKEFLRNADATRTQPSCEPEGNKP